MRIHHLDQSRSQRILWLLEEIGIEYEIVKHLRAPLFAPESLKQIHPLGKAPVLEDGDLVLAESGAIVEYLIERHGTGLAPARHGANWPAYLAWLHFAEGSIFLPMALRFYTFGACPASVERRIKEEMTSHLRYIDSQLGESLFLVENRLTGADVMMSYPLQLARVFEELTDYPRLKAYLERLESRPAWQAAVKRGGPYKLFGPGMASAD